MEKALEILGIIICCIAALYVLAGIILIVAAILGGLADEREQNNKNKV